MCGSSNRLYVPHQFGLEAVSDGSLAELLAYESRKQSQQYSCQMRYVLDFPRITTCTKSHDGEEDDR